MLCLLYRISRWYKNKEKIMLSMKPTSMTYTFKDHFCDLCYGSINVHTLKCTRCGEQYSWSRKYLNTLMSWYEFLREDSRKES